jgi:translation initiation factor 2B subunit (eIF-2B alpha/beta/delta family)
MKVDVSNNIEIEKRSANEVWKDRPKELEIINYAFDMIPGKFITGIITEFGIIKPKDIRKMVKKHYPWMLK